MNKKSNWLQKKEVSEISLLSVEERSLGKTLDTYRNLAVTLNSFPKEKEITIKDLAEKAQVHWNTAMKALLFFHQVSPIIPKFKLRSSLKFQIVEKPGAMEAVEGIFDSGEMRILTKIMLHKATNPANAQKMNKMLSEDEKHLLPDLIERGFVNSTEGCYYLSKRGQSLGSLGLQKIVELGIPLPWEKELEEHTPKTPLALGSKQQVYATRWVREPLRSVYSDFAQKQESKASRWVCLTR